jgi:hypothetical protein
MAEFGARRAAKKRIAAEAAERKRVDAKRAAEATEKLLGDRPPHVHEPLFPEAAAAAAAAVSAREWKRVADKYAERLADLKEESKAAHARRVARELRFEPPDRVEGWVRNEKEFEPYKPPPYNSAARGRDEAISVGRFDRRKLKTPIEYFRLFFDDEVMDHIVNCTNKELKDREGDAFQPIDRKTIEAVLGTVLLIAKARMGTIVSYWDEKYGYEPVRRLWARRKFLRIWWALSVFSMASTRRVATRSKRRRFASACRRLSGSPI